MHHKHTSSKTDKWWNWSPGRLSFDLKGSEMTISWPSVDAGDILSSLARPKIEFLTVCLFITFKGNVLFSVEMPPYLLRDLLYDGDVRWYEGFFYNSVMLNILLMTFLSEFSAQNLMTGSLDRCNGFFLIWTIKIIVCLAKLEYYFWKEFDAHFSVI